jgi:hypothetical protein
MKLTEKINRTVNELGEETIESQLKAILKLTQLAHSKAEDYNRFLSDNEIDSLDIRQGRIANAIRSLCKEMLEVI